MPTKEERSVQVDLSLKIEDGEGDGEKGSEGGKGELGGVPEEVEEEEEEDLKMGEEERQLDKGRQGGGDETMPDSLANDEVGSDFAKKFCYRYIVMKFLLGISQLLRLQAELARMKEENRILKEGIERAMKDYCDLRNKFAAIQQQERQKPTQVSFYPLSIETSMERETENSNALYVYLDWNTTFHINLHPFYINRIQKSFFLLGEESVKNSEAQADCCPVKRMIRSVQKKSTTSG